MGIILNQSQFHVDCTVVNVLTNNNKARNNYCTNEAMLKPSNDATSFCSYAAQLQKLSHLSLIPDIPDDNESTLSSSSV